MNEIHEFLYVISVSYCPSYVLLLLTSYVAPSTSLVNLIVFTMAAVMAGAGVELLQQSILALMLQ